jgi:uncharacterized protein (TIGR03067 family)
MNCRQRDLAVVFVAIVAGSIVSSAAAQSLDGTWEISSVIDDGRVIEPRDVLLYYAADGRVTINGNTVELIVPMTYQRKRLPFVVDDTGSPARVDLAGAEKTGGRGIFMASRDTLMLVLASRDKGRPTDFASLPGSGNLFVTLKRSSAGSGGGTTPSDPYTPPAYDDEQLRRMLIGTWGHQDAETIHYITLNPDRSMSTIMVWKDNFKKMFHQDVRSSGTWSLENGVVVLDITTSTDKERRGQVWSFRVRSINSTELVAVDANGQVRQEWKTP